MIAKEKKTMRYRQALYLPYFCWEWSAPQFLCHRLVGPYVVCPNESWLDPARILLMRKNVTINIMVKRKNILLKRILEQCTLGQQNFSEQGLFLQDSYSFELFKFHDFQLFFQGTFPGFHDLRLTITFKIFKTFLVFEDIYLTQFNRHKVWCPPKHVPFTLINVLSPSYLFFFLSHLHDN